MYDIYETPAFHILKTCAANRYNMRKLLKMLKLDHNKSYNIIRELKNAGLIKFLTKKHLRGRPTKTIILTQLGTEYLDRYKKLQSKRVQLTDNNIRKAINLANFTDYLVESAINPYDRFIEMNEIAFSIRGTQ
jgi:DNA-binding PadR family transcriptional regulator